MATMKEGFELALAIYKVTYHKHSPYHEMGSAMQHAEHLAELPFALLRNHYIEHTKQIPTYDVSASRAVKIAILKDIIAKLD